VIMSCQVSLSPYFKGSDNVVRIALRKEVASKTVEFIGSGSRCMTRFASP
jgi:hypothetical protein